MRKKIVSTLIYSNLLMVILTIFLAFTSIVAVITFKYHDHLNDNNFFFWAIKNHTSIMFVMVVLAITLGYVWSKIAQSHIMQARQGSYNLLNALFLFLNRDEKEIIHFLVKNNGVANQSEISRLEGMNRVKTHRGLKRMQEKNLIEIVTQGKIRKIRLKENIFDILITRDGS